MIDLDTGETRVVGVWGYTERDADGLADECLGHSELARVGGPRAHRAHVRLLQMSTVYGFDTPDHDEATAALLIYAVYRSRDTRRFKVTPDLWAQIERFVKAAAKRADTLPRFLEALKPRLACGTLHPRWMEAGIRGVLLLGATASGEYVEVAGQPQREFLTGVLAHADAPKVLDLLYRETAYMVLLVRDRLEREKPLEQRFVVEDLEIPTP